MLLVSRFRVFQKPIATSVPTAIQIVRAACALHNWLRSSSECNYFSPGLIDKEDVDNYTFAPSSWREEQESRGLVRLQPFPPRFSDRYARERRDNYCEYFNGIGAVPWQNTMIC